MNTTQILVVLAFALPMLAVVFGRLRMDLAALMMMALLGLLQFTGLGVLGPPVTPGDALGALSGFSQSAVVVLACLFILTAALEKSGFSRWLSRKILQVGGGTVNRLAISFSGVTAMFSLVMNDVAAGALLIPSVMEATRRTGTRPSKLLIPVSFGSLLGGMATYFTTANLLAADLLKMTVPGGASLSILDFLLTGGFIALAGLVFLGFSSDRLLPARESLIAARLHRPTGSEMEELYQLGERSWHARLLPDSPLLGQTLREIGLGENYGLTLAAVQRGGSSLLFPSPDMVLQTSDRLLLIGRQERIDQLEDANVKIRREDSRSHLSERGITVFELLIPPRSNALGKNLKDLDFRSEFGCSVIALQRGGQTIRTDVGDMRLAVGDALLVVGESDRRRQMRDSHDFILIEPSPADQPLCRRDAFLTLGLLAAGIIAAVAGVPVYLAMLAAALLAILGGAISMQEAYQAMEWQVIFVVGGMYSLSQAMLQSGLAELAGGWLGAISDQFGLLGLAGGAYMISALLTQLMGGQIVILITGPIAISAALGLGTDPRAIALAAALGCSASFLTPMAHPVNLLMMVPGGYTFQDFWRIGWRVFLITFAAFILAMMLFWGL
jgi:di/tricarboxylate transporter